MVIPALVTPISTRLPCSSLLASLARLMASGDRGQRRAAIFLVRRKVKRQREPKPVGDDVAARGEAPVDGGAQSDYQ